MTMKSQTLAGLAGAYIAVALFSAVPTAQSAQIKAVEGPTPGDCKRTFSVAMAPNPALAQTAWQNAVASQHGAKWAHWVGAKNKMIIPHGSGASAQYEARAFPCFYQPVP